MVRLVPSAQTSRPAPDTGWAMFDLAPVSLWIEDFSALRVLFQQWRAQGVDDLRSFLLADPDRMRQCVARVQVVNVNQRTLDLFEAGSLDELKSRTSEIFCGPVVRDVLDELQALWDGRLEFAGQGVNHTLGGRRLDVFIRGRIMPGYEDNWRLVLLALEDVTERERAVRRQAASEAYAHGLFQHSPVSLWVEDFSGVKALVDALRASGVTQIETYLPGHPDFIERCLSAIRLVDVNRQTLALFKAPDRDTFMSRLDDVIGPRRREQFGHLLGCLWRGELEQEHEAVCFALDGSAIQLQYHFSILPGCEADWSRVQLAMIDITNRKRAETYLEFLGSHDALTKLHNRTFYDEEARRLQGQADRPLTIVMVDLNGLKEVNDLHGHAAGDALLVRAGAVLAGAVDPPASVSRIGGDEFVILLPGAGAGAADALVARLTERVAFNNRQHAGATLSFAMGHATQQNGETLEQTERRADKAMYDAKRHHYGNRLDRRRV